MRRVFLTLLTIVALTSAAGAADSTYRDARRPSFTLLVPDGWTAEPHGQGVTIQGDGAYFVLIVNRGAMSPGAMLVQMRSQLEQQWKPFKEVGAGRAVFGGQEGAFGVYSGVPPSGHASIVRVVTMTNGQMTYVAFADTHADKTARRRPELDRIERSFTPDPPR